ARVFRALKVDFQRGQLYLRRNQLFSGYMEGQVLNRDLIVQIVDGCGVWPFEKPNLHGAELNQPGGLPLVKHLESEDLLIPVERLLQVLHADREVIYKIELHLSAPRPCRARGAGGSPAPRLWTTC